MRTEMNKNENLKDVMNVLLLVNYYKLMVLLTNFSMVILKNIVYMVKKYNSRFSVEPISKKTTFLKLPKRYNLDYHQWLPNVVIELINEYYLKDAKAS